MYELNNESILKIIKLSNTILTLSQDENNLSLPFSIFYQNNINLPFTKYVESSFSYLNNVNIKDENEIENTEYIIDINSENNQSTKRILNNFRNNLDLLKKVNENNEKENKEMNDTKPKIKRAKTPISKRVKDNNQIKNRKKDYKPKNINKYNKDNIKKENNLNKTDLNISNNNRENIFNRNKRDYNKKSFLKKHSKKKCKVKDNSYISIKEIDLTNYNFRGYTPDSSRKKTKIPCIEFHIDFTEQEKQYKETKLRNCLKDDLK